MSEISTLNLKKIETVNGNNKKPITINKLESDVISYPVLPGGGSSIQLNQYNESTEKIQVSHIVLDDTIKPMIEPGKSEVNTEINKLSLELNKSTSPTSDTIILEKDIDDTETLDGFINDSTKLLEKKGISIEKEESVDNKKVFSFFDDLED